MMYTLNIIVFSATVLLISIPVVTGLIGNFENPECGKSVFSN